MTAIDPAERPFLSVSEAADLLGVSHTTVTKAIDMGRLAAVTLTDDHRSTRIRRCDLFPSDESKIDLRERRLRRLQLDARTKREAAAALENRAREAREAADAAAQAVDDELGLLELDAATRRKAS